MANLTEQATWETGIRRIEPGDFVEGGEGGIDNIAIKQLANRTQFLKTEQERQGLEVKKNIEDIEGLDDGQSVQGIAIAALIKRLELLENATPPTPQLFAVGDLYVTATHFATAAEVAVRMGYGIWKRFAEGRAIVGFSGKPSDPEWTRTPQSEFGEYGVGIDRANLPATRIGNGSLDDPANGTQPSSHAFGSVAAGALAPLKARGVVNVTDYVQDQFVGLTETLGEGSPLSVVQPSIIVDCWIRTS